MEQREANEGSWQKGEFRIGSQINVNGKEEVEKERDVRYLLAGTGKRESTTMRS